MNKMKEKENIKFHHEEFLKDPPKKISIEARKNDGSWDGSQDLNTLPLIASYKTNIKLFYEFHMFGKNILEIKKQKKLIRYEMSKVWL